MAEETKKRWQHGFESRRGDQPSQIQGYMTFIQSVLSNGTDLPSQIQGSLYGGACENPPILTTR